jgi:hypothetical protein
MMPHPSDPRSPGIKNYLDNLSHEEKQTWWGKNRIWFNQLSDEQKRSFLNKIETRNYSNSHKAGQNKPRTTPSPQAQMRALSSNMSVSEQMHCIPTQNTRIRNLRTSNLGKGQGTRGKLQPR